MLISPTINSLHGRIIAITGTNPAAGGDILEIVPTRRRWRILSISFNLVTDATVVDRRILLIIDDGSTRFFEFSLKTTQAASTTYTYSFAPTGAPEAHDRLSVVVPIPLIILTAGQRFRTNLIAGVAGDDFTAPTFLVEEWIDP